MLKNKGNLGAFSPDWLYEKGLERRNPVIAVLGDYETAFSPKTGTQPVYQSFQGTGTIDILEFEFKTV
ncbi:MULTISPECIES: hypothetical protein [Paenibacillus]|uniref:hypothetical protein n=1 Tax=Paenibacillus TaxID=44249 RepID=UPI0011144010|nr:MULTISPECIES: hypothetical protein [Paenibacillus]